MFIQSAEAQIFTLSFGSSAFPSILGIGGWIGNWELWSQPFSTLSVRWHTIAYDHRGSGATIAPLESITFANLVEDVIAVLDAYRVEQCLLAAESAGALTALGTALKYPRRVSGLVIVDGLYYQSPLEADDTFLVGLQNNYARTLDWFVEACVPEEGCEPVKRWGRQILDRAAPEAAIALYRMASTIDLRPELASIRQKTLILHGDADRLVPPAAAHWLAETLPNASLAILPGAGHVPTMTRPGEVAREIMDFFNAEYHPVQ